MTSIVILKMVTTVNLSFLYRGSTLAKMGRGGEGG